MENSCVLDKGDTMLEYVYFEEDYRTFKKGSKIEFRKGVNLIVGDNGTGKSSLLSLLLSLRSGKLTNGTITIKTMDNIVNNTYAYDFEKDNIRTKSYLSEGNAAFEVCSKFKSHGEVNKSVIKSITRLLTNDDIIIVDEPDMALSVKSIIWLGKFFHKVGKNTQIIAAVHNPYLMLQEKEILNIETLQWEDSINYLKNFEDSIKLFE
jgi:predicted ATPase